MDEGERQAVKIKGKGDCVEPLNCGLGVRPLTALLQEGSRARLDFKTQRYASGEESRGAGKNGGKKGACVPLVFKTSSEAIRFRTEKDRGKEGRQIRFVVNYARICRS